MTPFQPNYEYLHQFIEQALWEDVRTGDITANACIAADKRDRAVLKIKADGILAGVELAKLIFKQVDATATVTVFKNDGEAMQMGEIAFEVEGLTRGLLAAERLVLNTMQRMSAIATMSHQYAQKVADLPVKILDTRKTTPLIRHLEKWAVTIGGCYNYRIGLYDWFLIKDNHSDASGGVANAIERVEAYREAHQLQAVGLTVEVRSLAELQTVLESKSGTVQQIMLDNFTTAHMRKAIKINNLHATASAQPRIELEASGGVTLRNLRQVALTGVDFISSGALTHGVTSLDLSLKIVK
jgi:nicotinate-nucleotide pyrophosphorylase (carboxylating)